MNNLFSILLFSIILLTRADAATALATPEQQAEAFIKGFEIAKDCLKQVNAEIDRLKIISENTSEGMLISPDIHTRDFNIYTRICELEKDFLEEKSQAKRTQIADHLAILSYSNSLIPNTLIAQELRTKLFNKIGGERSDSAEYFIRCLVYDESTTEFSLTQDRRSNSAMSSYMSIAQAAQPLIQSGVITNGNYVISVYKHIDKLIFNFVTKIEPYRWSFDKPSIVLEIFDELKPDLSALAPRLYKINTNVKKVIDNHAAINFVLTKAFSDRFEEAISTIKLENQNKISDLTEEKVFRLILSRIDLYKKSIKKLEENQKTHSIKDGKHTHFIKMFTNHVEVYNSARTQIAVLKSSTSEITKKAAAEGLYLSLSIHLQHTKREWRESTEEFYIQPIIDFLASLISPEAKIFANIIVAEYEGAKAKYDIEFNDELHERWSLQQSRFVSIENEHLLKIAEDIASTYERFTTSFRALLSDHQSPLTLFETFKPLITQYKREVTKEVNALENLINKEISSSENKQKKKKSKKAAAKIKDKTETSDEKEESSPHPKAVNNSFSNNSPQEALETQGLLIEADTKAGDAKEKIDELATAASEATELHHFQKVLSSKAARFEQQNILYLSSADIAEGCTNQNLVKLVLAQQQPLSKKQLKKMRKEANRLKRAEADDAPKQTIEETKSDKLTEEDKKAAHAEQIKRDKKKKKALKAKIPRDQALQQQREAADLAAYNKQKLKNPVDKKVDTPSYTKKKFTFNRNAAEFKPALLAADKQQQEQGSEKDTTVGDYTGSNPSPQPVYHSQQAYNPDYAAWFAQQRAWQCAWEQYYASLGYPMIPYGYPTQQPHLPNGQEQQLRS